MLGALFEKVLQNRAFSSFGSEPELQDSCMAQICYNLKLSSILWCFVSAYLRQKCQHSRVKATQSLDHIKLLSANEEANFERTK